ncbi:response regulator [Mucilaginibacter sp. KACC 22063]|uniref:response regulator n=1 Tax=Mucilaginibacter sp. KACC 22063 TaxID=3025666 RepID=UPI002365F0B0|nr:response regulator transcription factor [Mucilaginibacter sp. KACC 22063]WDF53818.1 response regulator transcription factor [Mucilaginibacter sp. KACC 22063]
MKDIGLIEDDEVIRSAYGKYFNLTQSFNVVFAVSDIKDALMIKHIRPHIILLDVSLGSGSGIDGIKSLSQHFKGSRIVILSNLQDARLTKQAIENGAAGYLLKSSSMAYIAESLLKLDEGGMPFSPATISHVVSTNDHNNWVDSIPELTKREIELVKLLSEGWANKTAADKLNVTYFTVNQHLKNIYKKLGINSKSELISWYLNKKHK